MKKAMKLALDALEATSPLGFGTASDKRHYKAITALEEALAQPEQEPAAWVSEDVCEGQYIDGRPRKIWWECKKGVGTAFYTTPPQRTEERNFCPRCGKRTADLTVIHTCTPPQNIEQDLSEQGRKKSAILGNNIEEMVNNGLPFLTALDTALKVYDHHTPKLHPPQRTEPVGVMVSMDVSKGDEPEYRIFGRIYEVMKDGEGKDEVTYLAIEDSRNFDTPPQRTLVGLTDEEAQQTFARHNCTISTHLAGILTRAIEAKLKQKNGYGEEKNT